MMENRVNPQCSQLYENVCEAHFFMFDLQLYLDTHPNDEKARGMFREAVQQYKACAEAFEKCCYPLQVLSAGENGEWDWLFGAWPSERV